MKRPPFRKVAVYGSGLIVALGLVTEGAVLFEGYRAQRAWEKHSRGAEARGVSFGLEKFTPPLIPDTENFAATALFENLFSGDEEARKKSGEALGERLSLRPSKEKATQPKGSWKTCEKLDLTGWSEYLGEPDVLTALRKFEPEIAEITKAAQRPDVRFPSDYSKGSMMNLPHLTSIIHLANILRLRSVAELAQGRADRALADIDLIYRLGEYTTKKDALAITALVHLSVMAIGVQPVWEGLAMHQWSEDQLRRLQERLQGSDPLAMSRRAFERERVACVIGSKAFLEDRVTFEFLFPRPWWGILWPPNIRAVRYQNQLLTDRMFEAYLLPMIDVEARRVHPEKGDRLPELTAKYASWFPLYRMFSGPVVPALGQVVGRTAEGQTLRDQALIGCALERFRLTQGNFPATLDALVPRYLAEVPHDVLTGEPLKYRLTDNGGYLLYSPGINGTDEGGIVATDDNGRPDAKQGDWVWKMPGANAAPVIDSAASAAP